MDWVKILSAVFLIGMLVYLYPSMKHAVKHSPKGTSKDWQGFLVPLVGVILFIVLLTQMV